MHLGYAELATISEQQQQRHRWEKLPVDSSAVSQLKMKMITKWIASSVYKYAHSSAAGWIYVTLFTCLFHCKNQFYEQERSFPFRLVLQKKKTMILFVAEHFEDPPFKIGRKTADGRIPTAQSRRKRGRQSFDALHCCKEKGDRAIQPELQVLFT